MSPMSNITDKFLRESTSKKLNIAQTISSIKNTANYNELCELTDNNSPGVKNYLPWFIGLPFPQSYQELAQVPMVLEAFSLDREIEWLFLALRKGANKLKIFLELKQLFENYLIVGNYELAGETLTQIEKDICYSLWSLDNRLLLNQLTNGVAGNKKWLQVQIDKGLELNVEFLAIYFSERVEIESGVSNFYEKMLAAFNDYSGIDRDQLISFFTFKLDPYDSELIINPKSILEIGFKFSLIDRYLSFIKLCTLSVGNQSEMDLTHFYYKLSSLLTKIHDPILENVLNIKNDNWENKIKVNSEEFLAIHRLYLEGDYKNCFEKSKSFIDIHPTNFEAIKLLAKASIYLGFEEYKISPIILQKIIYCVRCVYMKNESTDIYAPFLLKIAYVLESFNIGFSLFDFFATELYDDNSFKKTSQVDQPYESVYFYRVYNKNSQLGYLNTLIKKYDNHPSIRYYKNILENHGLRNLDLVNGNPLRTKLIEIDFLINEEKYAEAIDQLTATLPHVKNIGFVYEKVSRRLYDCYVKSELFDDAIQLYINNYFISSSLAAKLNSERVIKISKKLRLRNVTPSLSIPIFYSINEEEEVDIFNALKLFLFNKQKNKPSELVIEDSDPEIKYYIFLLSKVCTTDVLKHSTIFAEPKDIFIERVNILHRLKDIDEKNIEQYEKELQSNIKRLIVLDGINKLDESKIFINEEGLYNSILKRHEPTYDRLILLLQIFDEPEKQIHSQLSLANSKIIGPALKELFYLIRHQYLFSQFGLVNYLSTRIRHGVFEAAIRPIFEKLNLVTEKNFSGNKYIENTYWISQIGETLSKDKIERINIELANFSSSVDSYISEILAYKLQIKTEGQNKEGLFNFAYSDSDIRVNEILQDQPLNFKQFVNRIYNILWERNEQNLKRIRDFIQVEMQLQFDGMLVNLEEALQKIFRKEITPELFVNISTCRGHLHKELGNISNWFVRTYSQMADFKLSDILDITTEYLNRSILSKQIKLRKDLDSNFIVKGKFYVHFSDLFRLFMTNAIKYSLLPGHLVPLTISNSNIDNNEVIIKITNPLDESVDKEKLLQTVTRIKLQYQNLEKLTGEVNSGLLKANNIIKSDFNCDSNSIDYLVMENSFEVVLKLNIKEIAV